MKCKVFFLLIIILSLFLRIFEVGSYPKTLYGDELAFGWNAYNILLTGADEYGTPYPLQFRSFDDYKAPVPVYLLVPFIRIFDLNAFSIRLPIVIASVLTVGSVYLLLSLFLNKKISILGMFLMAISPWHMHLSRGFFEAILSQLFFILGIYFFIKIQERLKDVIFSAVFFSLALYSYFTPRILVPLIIIFLFIWKIQVLPYIYGKKSFLKNSILSLFLLVVISIPLVKMMIYDGGFSRFQNLSKSADMMITDTVRRERYSSNLPEFWKTVFHNKILVKMRYLKDNYLEELSPNFWFIYGDNSLRYFTGNMGMFYLYEFLFFVIGVYFLFTQKKSTAVLFIGWILLALIPAALVGKPFAVRSVMLLPAPFVFTAYGIYKTSALIKKFKWNFLFSFLLSMFVAIAIGSLLIRYYFEYPVYAATWWGWENYTAYHLAKENEMKYDQIFLSDFYTGMPLAIAVYDKVDPITYRSAVKNPVYLADNRKFIKLGKFYIGSLDIDKKRLESGILPSHSLYIGRPEEVNSSETIQAPDDGRLLFQIYKTE